MQLNMYVVSKSCPLRPWLQLHKELPSGTATAFNRKAEGLLPAHCIRNRDTLISQYKSASKPTKNDKKEYMHRVGFVFPAEPDFSSAINLVLESWGWTMEDGERAQDCYDEAKAREDCVKATTQDSEVQDPPPTSVTSVTART